MTQLTVSIENPDMVRDIKKAIKMIRGVVSVKTEKTKPNARTLAAIKEVRDGKAIHCGSFDDYKKMVANLDDV
jgi:Asp-tRNA(Asn)/Glu-tRNA(Gln) amidotransferase C subunit